MYHEVEVFVPDENNQDMRDNTMTAQGYRGESAMRCGEIKPTDVEIQLHDGKLTVSGERSAPPPSGSSARYPVQELKYGAFQRSIDLPRDIQPRPTYLIVCSLWQIVATDTM